MSRAFLIVLDSVGCGGAPDAKDFGDEGANTLGHIALACAHSQTEDGRNGPLHIPNLAQLGLGNAIRLASGLETGLEVSNPAGLWGAATEISPGKDTPTGHWELAGVPVPWDWHYFPQSKPCFPENLSALAAKLAGTSGILGNCHASGTLIIEELAKEHQRTGWPICYTSVDSVFQIAAHEQTFGLDRLYQLCQDLAPHLHDMKVGRVIARPFIGTSEQGYTRTSNRRDYAMALPEPGLCDWVNTVGREVLSIGKISDIFSGSGVTRAVKGDDRQLMEHLLDAVKTMPDGSLTFANFVEFDAIYGHRRDVAGYARHLEWFDREISSILRILRPGDLILFTADHGNDPTWRGTDHTRERVPVLGAGLGPRSIGHVGFVDVAYSIADHLKISAPKKQRSFL